MNIKILISYMLVFEYKTSCFYHFLFLDKKLNKEIKYYYKSLSIRFCQLKAKKLRNTIFQDEIYI